MKIDNQQLRAEAEEYSSLPKALGALEMRGAACRVRPSFERALDVCRESRRSWGAYYARYGLNPSLADAGETEHLSRGLQLAADAVEAALRRAPAKRQAQLQSFLDNIRFRSKLLTALHGSDGVDKVKELLASDILQHG